MIPVRGYERHRVGVLGLGRSGLATARALAAGGAVPVCWDDSDGARATAEAEGFEIGDLRRDPAWEGMVALIVSPGIPHLYPAPHPVIERAYARKPRRWQSDAQHRGHNLDTGPALPLSPDIGR